MHQIRNTKNTFVSSYIEEFRHRMERECNLVEDMDKSKKFNEIIMMVKHVIDCCYRKILSMI